MFRVKDHIPVYRAPELTDIEEKDIKNVLQLKN